MTGISDRVSTMMATAVHMVSFYLFDRCPQVIVRVNS